MASHSDGVSTPGGCYRFGDVVVDPAAHVVFRAGEPQPVEPRAFTVLLVLLERHGDLVPRDELLDQVWGHRHVTPGVLTRAIAQLRAALGDDSHHPRYIQTRHSLGYAFIGELEAHAAEQAASPPGDGPEGGWHRRSTDNEPEPVPGDTAAAPATDAPARRARLVWWFLAGGAAVLAAVLWWGGGRDRAPRTAGASVAVLPFTSLGGDRGQDFFAEGLAVEMHDALAGVEGLKVAARIPPSAAAGLDPDVRILGRKLGVAAVLDASVRRDGDRVRINARLSDCRTGFTLWSRSYDRELGDVFQTQAEIAAEVVQSLLGVIPGQREALAARLSPTHSASAFDAYLRGLHQLGLAGSGGAGVDSAVQWFDRALEADRGFVRAQAGICRSELARFNSERNARAFENARAACAVAAEMAPGSAEVDLALGDLHRAKGELDQAMGYYAKARDDPARAPGALVGLAQVHAARGDHQRSVAYFEQALELSPGNGLIHGFLGFEQYQAGNLQAAIQAYARAVELRPDDADLWSSLGGAHLAAGENREAEAAFEASLRIRPTGQVLSNFADLRMQQGELAAAATLLRRALELDPGDPLIWGNLGDALRADPATAPQARDAYAHAAQITGDYLAINPDDATMAAAHGWYLMNLEQREQALARVERSGKLGASQPELALFNARTMAAAGERAAALRWIAIARESGVPESRIRAVPLLARILEPAGADPREQQDRPQ